MMLAIGLSAVLAGFGPSPTISPSISPSASPSVPLAIPQPWVNAPIDPKKNQYAHEIRNEPDGSVSDIIAERYICNCSVDQDMLINSGVFSMIPGTALQKSSAIECGDPAQRLLVTYPANAANTQKTVEIYMFRNGDSLIDFYYTFHAAVPSPDAEAELMTFCPPPSPTTH
jgi:hypothetical protein